MSNGHEVRLARMRAPNESTLVPAIGVATRYVATDVRRLLDRKAEARYYAGVLLDDAAFPRDGTTRACGECGEVRPIHHFGGANARQAGRLHFMCRTCRRRRIRTLSREHAARQGAAP